MEKFSVDIFISDMHETLLVNDVTTANELHWMVEKKLQVEEGSIKLHLGGNLIKGSSFNACRSLRLHFNPKITVKFEMCNKLSHCTEF